MGESEGIRSGEKFIGYFWWCCRHFGYKVWESKGAELLSALVLSVITGIVSLAFGEADALKALEIAVISLVGWLAVFAIGHLIRTPWLIHNGASDKDIVWGFGVVGIIAGILIIAGLGASGLWFYQLREPRISIPSADQGVKDQEIRRLEQVNSELNKRPESCRTIGGTSQKSLAQQCEHLGDCPDIELSKRANELASEIEGLGDDYRNYLNDQLKRCQLAPDRNKCQGDMVRMLSVIDKEAMRRYRMYKQSEVEAMRTALIHRIGEQDSEADGEYRTATTQFGRIDNLNQIAADLRKLAGKILALRQH